MKTLYEKVGKRYRKVNDYYEDRGLPEGLYLFYKPDYKGEHRAMMSMLHYAKVHQIEDVGRFCDLWVKHEDVLIKEISEGIDAWVKEKKQYSIHDLAMIVCKTLSNIKQ